MFAALAVFVWAHPAVNPYTGDFSSAVDRYADIPPPVRAALKEKIANRRYDAMVTITKAGVSDGYTNLRDMHFGAGKVVRGPVSTASWEKSRIERALVFCEQENCLIIPTVCRNVSRVTPPKEEKKRRAGIVFTSSVITPNSLFEEESWEHSIEWKFDYGMLKTDEPPIIPLPAIPPVWAQAISSQPLYAQPALQVPSIPATQVTPIPEPSTWALLGVGLLLTIWRRYGHAAAMASK